MRILSACSELSRHCESGVPDPRTALTIYLPPSIPLEAETAAVAYAHRAAENAAQLYGGTGPSPGLPDGCPTRDDGPQPTAAPSSTDGPAAQFHDCTGVKITLPAGMNPFTAYPFALHTHIHLPWDVHLVRGELVLQAHSCRKVIKKERAECEHCTRLMSNAALSGILHRIEKGVHKNATNIYQPIAGLMRKLDANADALDTLRITKYRQTQRILKRACVLDEHKKFLMAIASGRVTRVHALVRTALRRNAGIKRIVALMDLAAKGLYKPKSYEEEAFLRGLLFLRLGGTRVAELAHRTCGTPAVSTLRRSALTQALIPSVGMPRSKEILDNIDIAFPDTASSDPAPLSYVLMLDEIKISECCRWCPATNKILGLCREHSKGITTDFETIKEVELICDALNEERTHFASEVRRSDQADVSLLNHCPGDSRRSRCPLQGLTPLCGSSYSHLGNLQARSWRSAFRTHSDNRRGLRC